LPINIIFGKVALKILKILVMSEIPIRSLLVKWLFLLPERIIDKFLIVKKCQPFDPMILCHMLRLGDHLPSSLCLMTFLGSLPPLSNHSQILGILKLNTVHGRPQGLSHFGPSMLKHAGQDLVVLMEIRHEFVLLFLSRFRLISSVETYTIAKGEQVVGRSQQRLLLLLNHILLFKGAPIWSIITLALEIGLFLSHRFIISQNQIGHFLSQHIGGPLVAQKGRLGATRRLETLAHWKLV
jgi:hypothetical protein